MKFGSAGSVVLWATVAAAAAAGVVVINAADQQQQQPQQQPIIESQCEPVSLPVTVHFPSDLQPHLSQSVEWWWWIGNVWVHDSDSKGNDTDDTDHTDADDSNNNERKKKKNERHFGVLLGPYRFDPFQLCSSLTDSVLITTIGLSDTQRNVYDYHLEVNDCGLACGSPANPNNTTGTVAMQGVYWSFVQDTTDLDRFYLHMKSPAASSSSPVGGVGGWSVNLTLIQRSPGLAAVAFNGVGHMTQAITAHVDQPWLDVVDGTITITDNGDGEGDGSYSTKEMRVTRGSMYNQRAWMTDRFSSVASTTTAAPAPATGATAATAAAASSSQPPLAAPMHRGAALTTTASSATAAATTAAAGGQPEAVWDWAYAHLENGITCDFTLWRNTSTGAYLPIPSYLNCFNLPINNTCGGSSDGDDGDGAGAGDIKQVTASSSSSVTIDGTGFHWTRFKPWISPHSGLRYELGLIIEVTLTAINPVLGLNLTFTPYMDDNEMKYSLPIASAGGKVMYLYEGVASITGTYCGQPIRGTGSVEIVNPYQGAN